MRLFVVIGLGQLGRQAAKVLYDGGADVLAIDRNQACVDWIKDEVGQAVCANATDSEVLRTLGVDKADTVVVALGETELEQSILACSVLAELGVGRIIARAATELQGRILMRVGASRIVYPERQIGEQLAKSILTPGILEHVPLSTGQTVAHVRPHPGLIGKTIADTQLFERYRLAVIGIQHPKRSVDDRGELHVEMSLHSVPPPHTMIDEDDILIVVGYEPQIELIARKD